MKPPDYFFLTLKKGKLSCRAHDGWQDFDSLAGLSEFLAKRAAALGVNSEDLTVMCSSSLDFPEDETDDPKLIALCREIRG